MPSSTVDASTVSRMASPWSSTGADGAELLDDSGEHRLSPLSRSRLGGPRGRSRAGGTRGGGADRRACCFPSGLSPSVPEFHLVNRSLAVTGSRTVTAGSEFHRPRSTRAFSSSLPSLPIAVAAAMSAASQGPGPPPTGSSRPPASRTAGPRPKRWPTTASRGSARPARAAVDHRVRVVGAVDGRARDEDVSPGLRAALDRLRATPAVDLEPEFEPVRGDQLARAPDLGQHEVEELLAAEPGSTVIISSMSSSGSRSAYGSTGVAGFSAIDARAPLARGSRGRAGPGQRPPRRGR